MEMNQIEAKIEAILFTLGEAVECERIGQAIGYDVKTTKKFIHNMMDKYEKEDRGIRILELEGSYQLGTKAELYDVVTRITHIPKKNTLTDVLLETLSIIAYKQPVTKLEIESIRGVKSDHTVNKLVEYNLVQEIGRLDAPGKPILFGTTEEFLRNFGIHSVDDLPVANQDKMDNFKIEAEEEVQLRFDL